MPRSKAEVRLAHAVVAGKAKDSGMKPGYAKEVLNKMHGRKMSSLPDHRQSARKVRSGRRV